MRIRSLRTPSLALPSLAMLALTLLTANAAQAQDASTPGTPTTPHPTYANLSIDWPLSGDANNDGLVAVRYRPQGETMWRDGLPLQRVPAGSNAGFSWANRHAGSVFGLQPGTTYEVELSLDDADGGSTIETLTASTRSWPTVPTSGNVPVTPATIAQALGNAQPGDVLLLADGNYGPISIAVSGTPAAPIVLLAENAPGALVQGDIRIDGEADVHVIGLTVEGKIKFNNAARIVVRECNITTTEDGIVAYANGVEDALVVDNVVKGATQWSEAALGVSGNNTGFGVALTGPGNVIAFNRVSGFRDCISFLEGGDAVNQQSIDIYGNDLFECADDAIEADYSMGNVRVYQNQIVNAFMGISSQPSLGGPSYFVRNVMYNIVFQAFKLHNGSIGDVAFHNTVVKSGDALSVNTGASIERAFFRNNLFIGGPGGTYAGFNSGPGRAIQLPSADTASCSFDYDGYGAIGVGALMGNYGNIAFASEAEMNALTSEVNGFGLDLSTFASTIAYPADAIALSTAPDLRLADGAAAVDRGIPLPNINDAMTGAAPDIGAHELGVTPPIYGPGGSLTGNGGGGAGGSGGAGPGAGGGTAGSGGEGVGGTGVGGAGAGPGAGGSGGGNDSDGGCGCATVGSQSSGRWAGLGLLLALVGAIRRRHGRRA